MKRSIWTAGIGFLLERSGMRATWPMSARHLETSSIRYASAIPGMDMGSGNQRSLRQPPGHWRRNCGQESASFVTPIVFGTNDKPVLLVGLPADIVTLDLHWLQRNRHHL